MNSLRGKIISVAGRSATVEIDKSVVCPRCAAGKGCGAGLFTGSARSTQIDVELPAGIVFRSGDAVTLSISSSRLLHASMLAYGLPLAGALLLTFLGWLILAPLTDATGVALAVTGLIAGFSMGRRQLRKESCVRQFVPAITARSDVG